MFDVLVAEMRTAKGRRDGDGWCSARLPAPACVGRRFRARAPGRCRTRRRGDIFAPAAGAIVRAGDVVKIAGRTFRPMLTSLSFYSRSTAGGPFLSVLPRCSIPSLPRIPGAYRTCRPTAACLRLRVGEDDDEVMLRRVRCLNSPVTPRHQSGGSLSSTASGGRRGHRRRAARLEVEPWWSDQEPRGMDQWPRPRSPAASGCGRPANRDIGRRQQCSLEAPPSRGFLRKVAPQPPSPSESRPSFGRCHERPLKSPPSRAPNPRRGWGPLSGSETLCEVWHGGLSRHHLCTEPPQGLGTVVWPPRPCVRYGTAVVTPMRCVKRGTARANGDCLPAAPEEDTEVRRRKDRGQTETPIRRFSWSAVERLKARHGHSDRGDGGAGPKP